MASAIKKRMLIGLVAVIPFSLVMAYLAVVDRSPPHGMIDKSYWRCEKCGSLQGGIWGKGPTKFFDGPNRRWCVHRWEEISRDEFKRLASEQYGEDWSQESDRWQR